MLDSQSMQQLVDSGYLRPQCKKLPGSSKCTRACSNGNCPGGCKNFRMESAKCIATARLHKPLLMAART